MQQREQELLKNAKVVAKPCGCEERTLGDGRVLGRPCMYHTIEYMGKAAASLVAIEEQQLDLATKHAGAMKAFANCFHRLKEHLDIAGQQAGQPASDADLMRAHMQRLDRRG